ETQNDCKRPLISVDPRLADQDMGAQAGTRPAAVDLQIGPRRLMDRRAALARHLWRDTADELEVTRHVLQHLADVLAQRRELPTTGRAGRSRRMNDVFARRMATQRPARRPWSGGEAPE